MWIIPDRRIERRVETIISTEPAAAPDERD
jgi:hypothetical protein